MTNALHSSAQMTPILTIKLEKIQRKSKPEVNASVDDPRKNKLNKMRRTNNTNEYIESEATLDDDNPEKKGMLRLINLPCAA